MSHRLFENKTHIQFYSEYRPIPPASLMQYILSYLQEKYDGPLDQAIDLGCGSGQSTFALADLKKFKTIIGTDISLAQIEAAIAKYSAEPSVKFQVCPSENMPLDKNSCQLIISNAAAHWFDLDKVFEETRRVLCENGVIAFMCNSFPIYEWNSPNDELLNKAMQNVYDTIYEYWTPPARIALEKYKDIELPFSDVNRAEGFWIERKVELREITGLFRSFSAYQTLCEKIGDEKGHQILDDLHHTLADHVGDAPVVQKIPYFVVMARK